MRPHSERSARHAAAVNEYNSKDATGRDGRRLQPRLELARLALVLRHCRAIRLARAAEATEVSSSSSSSSRGMAADMARPPPGLLPAAVLLAVLGLAAAARAPAGAAEARPGLRFSRSPQDQRAAEGQSVRLRCEAEPSGGVSYAWTLDGRPLAPSPRRRLQGPAGDLLISRLSRILDSGRFVCRARHLASGASIDSSPAKIDVQWISESSVHLQQPKLASHVRPGMKLELRCQVDGSGELKYEWFKNTKSIQSSARVETKRNLLLISEARPEDSGVYRCLARNSAGASAVARSLALAVVSNDTARVRVPPQNVMVRRGESARFSCAFDNAERVEWYFEEGTAPIESDAEMYVSEDNDLVIVSAQDRHKGFYSCHGFGPGGGAAQVYAAELQIAYLRSLGDESFEPPLRDRLALVGEGQELQVACLAPAGLPRPRIFWRDPQQRLVSDAGPVRVQDDTLIIAEAQAARDQGNYSCVAENLAGSSALTLRVVVTWPPELLETPPRVLGLWEDEPLALSCAYRAMQAPFSQFSWWKDRERLAEPTPPAQASGRYRFVEQPGNYTLLFKAVQLADRGNYVCEIATGGFPAVRSAPTLLTVKEKLKFSPPPVDRRLELNSTAKVSCKAQGSSPVSFKWYKNGSTAHFPKHVQEANGTLHFGGVLEDDKGNYTCVASNSQGQINHTIRIDVVIAPKFTVKPENVTALEGASAILHCSAEGDPKPTIHWDKDSQMNNMHGERFVKLPNDSLYIREVYLSDEGKYGCTAGNSGGLKREEVHLSVRATAGEPDAGADADLEPGDGSMMTRTVLVTLGAAAAYMLLVIGLMVYCRVRRRRRKQRYLQEQSDRAEKAPGQAQAREAEEELQCDLQEVAAGKPPSAASGRRRDKQRESQNKSDGTDTAHSQNSGHSKRSKSSYDKLAVSRSQLQEPMKPLGRGEFGEVFSAKFRPAGAEAQQPDRESTVVMVKTLSNTKDEAVLQEFKRHLDLLRKLEHDNLARLIGLCRDEEPDYMIIEYTDWGDLKQFLLASKAEEPRAPQLGLPQILSLADQAAQALKYVAEHRFVHKDVAARNCLITSSLGLKLSLACMSKEPHQQEYTKHRNQVIPLRWMPREAVFEDEFSTKSDVYAYAVLVWEMFHQGELPFRKLNDESVLAQLKAQTLSWTAPKAAPPALQQLQTKCWSYDPRERPTFDQLAEELRELAVSAARKAD